MKLSTDRILDYAACPKKMKLTQKPKKWEGGSLLHSARSWRLSFQIEEAIEESYTGG